MFTFVHSARSAGPKMRGNDALKMWVFFAAVGHAFGKNWANALASSRFPRSFFRALCVPLRPFLPTFSPLLFALRYLPRNGLGARRSTSTLARVNILSHLKKSVFSIAEKSPS